MFIPLHDTNALNHVRVQYVTLLLIVANVVIWAVWNTPTLTGEDAVHATFLSFGYIPAVINGYETLPQIYTVLPTEASFVTYSFFHSSFMHLAGNMLFLWVFGDNVEDAMGHIRFLLFYLACAAAGAWLHGIINAESVSPLIGASGAAAGVITAYLLLHPRVKIWVLMFGKIPLRISALWVIGAWISYQVFELVFNSSSDVSWGAHVGGIVMGAILILFMRRSGVRLLDQNVEGKSSSKKNIKAGESSTEDEIYTDAVEKALTKPISPKTPSAHRPSALPPSPWGRGGDTN